MRTADLIKAFRAAAWPAPQDVARFLRDAGQVPPADVEKLLETLQDPELAADAKGQEQRRAALEAVLTQSLSRELFKPLTRALGTVDADTRRVLIKIIPRTWDPTKPDDAVALFKSDSETVRAAAAEMMGPITGIPVQNGLAELARAPNNPGRKECLDGLVKLLGPKCVPAIHAALAVCNVPEKLHAIGCLSDARVAGVAPKDALAAMLPLFSDAADAVVVRVIQAYGALCSEDEFFATVVHGLQSPRLELVRAVVLSLTRFTGSARALDALEWRFRQGPMVLRLEILDALGKMNVDRVVPILAEALANPHITVRNRAASTLRALGESGRVNLHQTLRWLLQHQDPNVRRMALDISLRLEDPDHVFWPDLIPYLGDADWWVRQRTVDVLVALGGARLLQRLPALVRSGSPVFRLYAVEALERLGDPAGLPLLLEILDKDPDALVKERALEALGHLHGPGGLAALLNWLHADPDLQPTVLEALQLLGDRGAAPEVARLTVSPDADIRALVVSCLDALDDPSQASLVEPLRKDEDARVKRMATTLLERWESYGPVTSDAVGSSSLEALLEAALDLEADTIILASGSRPLFKKLGATHPLNTSPLPGDHVKRMVLPLLSPKQHHTYTDSHEVDFSFELRSRQRRFRVHAFAQQEGPTVIFQAGRAELVGLDALGLPEVVKTLGEFKAGLVLLAGPAGSGKSSSLHGIIQHVNQHSTRHVITLESGIEVVHQPVHSVITQREVGRHARDLPSALKASLREDPDLICIDDLRDVDAISFALTAAETGHLVVGVLQIPVPSAQAALERVIKAFPPAQQESIQVMISSSLRAVLAQRLVPTLSGTSRLPVCEVLINTPAVANLIRKGKVQQVGTTIATSTDAGMQLMDADFQRKLKDGLIQNPDAPKAPPPAAKPAVPPARQATATAAQPVRAQGTGTQPAMPAVRPPAAAPHAPAAPATRPSMPAATVAPAVPVAAGTPLFVAPLSSAPPPPMAPAVAATAPLFVAPAATPFVAPPAAPVVQGAPAAPTPGPAPAPKSLGAVALTRVAVANPAAPAAAPVAPPTAPATAPGWPPPDDGSGPVF